MKPLRVLETSLYARDLEAAERFYAGVLGLPVISRQPGRHVFLRCGEGVLLLFDPRSTRSGPSTIPAHGAEGPGHAALAVPAAELDHWREHLKGAGVAIEAEVEWPGGGRSLYVRDPAGNSLELATPAVWGLPESESPSAP